MDYKIQDLPKCKLSDFKQCELIHIVPIKKRSFFGRIVRLPKLFKHNWKFANNMKFFDRIGFCIDMALIVMK